MASIFTKIINGEIPCHKIAESDTCLAFLDINPLTTGHTLVIPKKEVDYIFDLDDETYVELNLFAKKVGLAVEKAIPCLRIGTTVIGVEVPHAHIHLIPLNTMDDINFSKPKMQPSQETLSMVAEKIRKEVNF